MNRNAPKSTSSIDPDRAAERAEIAKIFTADIGVYTELAAQLFGEGRVQRQHIMDLSDRIPLEPRSEYDETVRDLQVAVVTTRDLFFGPDVPIDPDFVFRVYDAMFGNEDEDGESAAE